MLQFVRGGLTLVPTARADFTQVNWMLGVVLVASGCTTSADIETREMVSVFGSATRQAIECRSTIANRSEYRTIAARMPLLDVNQATLIQMLDTTLVNSEEYMALASWQQDVRGCGNELVEVIRRTAPAYVPIVLTAWNKDDDVFVLLARRKIAWGEAVMRLKTNRTELLSKLADQMTRMMIQLSQRRQAELNRRASLFESMIGLVP